MWFVLLLLLCYAFKQNLHAVSHHHTIVDTDKIRPPKRPGRRRRLRRRSARVRTHNGRRARASRPILETSPAAITDTHLPAGVRTAYSRSGRPRSTRPAQHRAGLLGAAAHAARASKPRRAQSGRAHRRPRHRGSPPGAENAEREGTMGVVSVILAVGPRIVQRPPGVRGPLSTFLSRRCALSVHRVHAPCPRH